MHETDYDRLVEPHRGELRAHCYRMLGSAQDAEDALQEAMLRAWRGLARFEGRSSLRSWLYTIATNVCLKMLERRRRLVLPVDYGPPADPHDGPSEPILESVWVEPYPDEGLALGNPLAGPEARYDQRESVELAFIAALQHLPARQRAVLILRDVLGFSAREVAEALDATPASIDTALQRARKNADERLPARSQQATLREIGDARLRETVNRFVAAWERADVDAVVGLLTEDALMTMPPLATWFRGRDAIAIFLAGWPLSGRPSRLVPTHANGQPAFAHYFWEDERDAYVFVDIIVMTMEGSRIGELTAFLTPELFERFGVPEELPA